MKSYISRHREYIQYLSVCTLKQAQILIKISTDNEIKTICEVALNYINKRINTIQGFEKRHNLLNNLASKDISVSRKREILINSSCYTKVVQTLARKVIK